MEKLFLRRFLACDEMNVVDKERIDLAELRTEALGRLLRDGFDKLIREVFRRDKHDGRGRVAFEDFLADSLHQVGLAQPGVAMEEKGVIAAGGRFRHGARGRVGKPVARTDDEAVKRVTRVETFKAANGRTGNAPLGGGGGINGRSVDGHGNGGRRHKPYLLKVGDDLAQALAYSVEIVVSQPRGKELAGDVDDEASVLARLEPRLRKQFL